MTTLAQDITDDYRDFDGLETVTLHRQSAGGLEQVAISYTDDDGATQGGALRRQASYRDQMAANAIGLTSVEVVWELPATLVGSSGVRQGNIIVDSSDVYWHVNIAQLATLGTRWRCLTTRQET